MDANIPATMPANLPPVVDVCCGSRMFWFDKTDSRCLYLDRRAQSYSVRYKTRNSEIVINPDLQCDFANLPFEDSAFSLAVFDPPHIPSNSDGELTRLYGKLQGDWRKMLSDGFRECFRVLKPGGVLIFKWNEVSVPLREILALTDEKPLFGHRSGKRSQTHWCTFMKAHADKDETN